MLGRGFARSKSAWMLDIMVLAIEAILCMVTILANVI